jgi:hypothetical protein
MRDCVETEGVGSRQIDHQQNYPGGGADTTNIVHTLPDSKVHFCRGCGGSCLLERETTFIPIASEQTNGDGFRPDERGSMTDS